MNYSILFPIWLPIFHIFQLVKKDFFDKLVNPHDLDMSQEINVSQRREVQVWNDYWFGSDARPLLNTDTM